MTPILKYFLPCKLIFFLAVPFVAFCQQVSGQEGQQQEQEQPRPEIPKVNRDFSLAALRIGFSLTDLIQPVLYEGLEQAYAVQADLSIDRFMLVADVGTAKYAHAWEPQDTLATQYQYTTEGNYFKVGIDVNFLKDKEANTRFAKDDVIFFGLRYAQSSFTANATFDVADSVWGDFTQIENNENLRAWWVEMEAGIKVEIFNNVFLGYTMQFRFLKNFSRKEDLTPYDVPGFGSGNRKNIFGFDYYLMYRIPFK